ncbi:MAG: carbamoyltransferase N-terminal domain-containing protein, partial [Candidatus Acidiferrales bacterium]
MISVGINYSQMHDSSACIARNGEILFAVAEERLSRVKHDARFPALSIRACLEFAGVRAGQIDFMCQSWPHARAMLFHDLSSLAAGHQTREMRALVNSSRYFLSMWHQRGGENRFRQEFGAAKTRFRFVDHHLAHAISAYAYSGF